MQGIRGILRSIDRQGRLTIPKEILKAADIGPGDLIELLYSTEESGGGNPKVIIEKYTPGCHFCGTLLTADTTWEHHGKRVCVDCLRELAQAYDTVKKQKILREDSYRERLLKKFEFTCPVCGSPQRAMIGIGLGSEDDDPYNTYNCKNEQCKSWLRLEVKGGLLNVTRMERQTDQRRFPY